MGTGVGVALWGWAVFALSLEGICRRCFGAVTALIQGECEGNGGNDSFERI